MRRRAAGIARPGIVIVATNASRILRLLLRARAIIVAHRWVVLAYLGLLFYTQRTGTHADLKRLVTTLALPVFATLNTIAVVTRPPTALTRIFSLLWLLVVMVGGGWIGMGSRQPAIARVDRHYAVAALILCVAVAARNVVYLVT